MRSKISKFPGGLTPNLALTSDCVLRALLAAAAYSMRPFTYECINILLYILLH